MYFVVQGYLFGGSVKELI